MQFPGRRVLSRIALGCIAALATCGAAAAADLGGPRLEPFNEPPSLERPAEAHRWAGFYLGASLGYASGGLNLQNATSIQAGSYDISGATYSAFAGYNFQIHNLVLGIEGELGSGGLKGHGANTVHTFSSELNWLAAARVRAGFLLGPALLVYGQGGFATASLDVNVGGPGGIGRSQTFSGYQIGAGAELMFAPNWTLRLDYIYTDLGRQATDYPGVRYFNDPDFHTVRAGLSLKF